MIEKIEVGKKYRVDFNILRTLLTSKVRWYGDNGIILISEVDTDGNGLWAYMDEKDHYCSWWINKKYLLPLEEIDLSVKGFYTDEDVLVDISDNKDFIDYCTGYLAIVNFVSFFTSPFIFLVMKNSSFDSPWSLQYLYRRLTRKR